MPFQYVTIFEEKGRYEPKFDKWPEGQEQNTRLAESVGARIVFRGEIQSIEQGDALNKFVKQANKTGGFDKEKLEELLCGKPRIEIPEKNENQEFQGVIDYMNKRLKDWGVHSLKMWYDENELWYEAEEDITGRSMIIRLEHSEDITDKIKPHIKLAALTGASKRIFNFPELLNEEATLKELVDESGITGFVDVAPTDGDLGQLLHYAFTEDRITEKNSMNHKYSCDLMGIKSAKEGFELALKIYRS